MFRYCCLLGALLFMTVTSWNVSLIHKTSCSRRQTTLMAMHQPEQKSYGLYVHIPYCRRRCNYCDFAIVPIGNMEQGDSRTIGFHKMDTDYRNAILNEINLIGRSSSHDRKIPLRSIYFGGGTPSLAPLSTLQEIMDAILHSESAPFQLMDENSDADPTEISIECDPGTFDKPFLESIKSMGFNRISLGVQSFDDDILTIMGRFHRSADIYNSIRLIAEVFSEDANYSIDLISGVPGLTVDGWKDTLRKAVSLHPQPMHISVYDLQVEKGTAFGRWYVDETIDENEEEASQLKRMPNTTSTPHPSLPSIDDCASMYREASTYLRSNNYEHYEISSYARIDDDNGRSHRSKHNQIYWEIGGEWYAIGLGATSNINGFRYSRPRALSDYISDVGDETQWISNVSRHESYEVVDKDDDALLDIIMTRLRTSDGLDLEWVAKEYGDSYVKAIMKGLRYFEEETDLIKVSPGNIKLTDPDGFLFSNNIISNIFVELD